MNLQPFFTKFNIRTSNIEIYERAFTHASYNFDSENLSGDYERLEFVGDSVLGFVVASLIFKYHKKQDEGTMTKMKAYLVKSESLAKYACKLGLDNYIRAGKSLTSEAARHNRNILEDVFEAVVGAIYVDQGINFVTNFLTNIYLEDVINFDFSNLMDYKSALQEAVQAETRESVVYKTVNQTGPSNDRVFEVEVLFNDIVYGKGIGKSKKEAEQNAAKDALSKVALK